MGLARAKSRGAPDRFECEQKEFFEAVRTAYWQRVRENPQRFAVIDAGEPLEQVQTAIASELTKLLAQFKP